MSNTASLATREDQGIDLLRGESNSTAIIADGRAISYAELGARVRDRGHELGAGRRLVMLETSNTLDPLITYLAALSAGHPVLLLPGGVSSNASHRAGLIDLYDPDTVVTAESASSVIEVRRDRSAHDLHPDLALLMTTSGSTGSPKLVRLSRANVLSNARSIASYLALTGADRAATTLPFHYCYGLSVVNSHFVSGASVAVTDRSVVEPEFWTEFESAGATSFAGVPYTFDLLDSVGFSTRRIPGLRYITQAGGRLASDRVRSYVALGARRGFDFVVMYGQTEATARMAYLPPSLAAENPTSIGVPIPGGSFRLENPDDNGVGELVYSGGNVMMGYAESPGDLALGRVVDELRTGDLATMSSAGLIEIVGRSSRFVKLFGLRVDLDGVERVLAGHAIEARAVSVGERLVIFVRDETAIERIRPAIAQGVGIPGHGIRVGIVEEFPRTASGKPDLAALTILADEARPCATASAFASVLDDGSATAAERVRRLYATVLERPDAGHDDSFVDLDGDSLSYVEASVRLEQLIGRLPRDWPAMSARDLGALIPHPSATDATGHVTDDATPTDDAPRKRAWWSLASVEAPVALRALAIVLVTATHANLLTVQGGAHLLLGVLGYNLARFQLAAPTTRSRVRKLFRNAAAVAVPATIWIGGVALVTGYYSPVTALLLNNVAGDAGAWTVQWQFWFLEALVWGTVGIAALFALPGVDRLERRFPYAFAAVLVAGALALRLVVTGGVQASSPERYSIPVVLWLVAVGWLVARSTDTARKIATSVVVAVGVWGFFGDAAREAVIVAGLLVLLWVRSVRLPRLLVPAVGMLAGASLFIYLVQWQVYPWLEDDFPLAATLASFAAGIVVWKLNAFVRMTWSRLRDHHQRRGGATRALERA